MDVTVLNFFQTINNYALFSLRMKERSFNLATKLCRLLTLVVFQTTIEFKLIFKKMLTNSKVSKLVLCVGEVAASVAFAINKTWRTYREAICFLHTILFFFVVAVIIVIDTIKNNNYNYNIFIITIIIIISITNIKFIVERISLKSPHWPIHDCALIRFISYKHIEYINLCLTFAKSMSEIDCHVTRSS